LSASSASNIAVQSALDSKATGEILDLAPGEYAGPFAIRRRVTVDGHGATFWALKGPLVVVCSRGVVLRNLRIEVTGDESEKDADEACAIQVNPGADLHLENVDVRGGIRGLEEEEGEWRYPKSIHLGALSHGRPHVLIVRLFVAVACCVSSEVSGLSVDPRRLVAGANELRVRVDSVSRDTLLYGRIVFATPFTRRFLMVSAQISASADSGADAAGGEIVVWEPADWLALTKTNVVSQPDELPVDETDLIPSDPKKAPDPPSPTADEPPTAPTFEPPVYVKSLPQEHGLWGIGESALESQSDLSPARDEAPWESSGKQGRSQSDAKPAPGGPFENPSTADGTSSPVITPANDVTQARCRRVPVSDIFRDEALTMLDSVGCAETPASGSKPPTNSSDVSDAINPMASQETRLDPIRVRTRPVSVIFDAVQAPPCEGENAIVKCSDAVGNAIVAPSPQAPSNVVANGQSESESAAKEATESAKKRAVQMRPLSSIFSANSNQQGRESSTSD
jgi:hypothetical protein